MESECPHFPNIFALGGALEMFNKIGQEKVETRVIYLNRYLENKLKNLGIEVICQNDDKFRSGILIAKIPNAKSIVNELFKKNIIVSARGEGIRVSTSIFNNEEDIEILKKELNKILNII